MKTTFLAICLLFGIPGLVLGLMALSDLTRNPVAAVIGITVGGLAVVCLWLGKECLTDGQAGPVAGA